MDESATTPTQPKGIIAFPDGAQYMRGHRGNLICIAKRTLRRGRTNHLRPGFKKPGAR